ncbi:MAG: hypothetical protein AAF514_24965 [Verrucomicrobiota bacterium]
MPPLDTDPIRLLIACGLLLVGLLAFIPGKAMAVVAALEKKETAWAMILIILAPFFPPVALIYCFFNWKACRIAFWIMFPAIVIMMAGLVILVLELWNLTDQIFDL